MDKCKLLFCSAVLIEFGCGYVQYVLYDIIHLLQVTDVLKFLPTRVSDVSLEFLWCSECSGYRHLYLITAKPPEKSFSLVLKAECSVQQLTAGCWMVFGSEVLEFHVVPHYALCVWVLFSRSGWMYNIVLYFLKPT